MKSALGYSLVCYAAVAVVGLAMLGYVVSAVVKETEQSYAYTPAELRKNLREKSCTPTGQAVALDYPNTRSVRRSTLYTCSGGEIYIIDDALLKRKL